MVLEIALLGTPRATTDGEPVTVDTRKATALLAYLAVTERPHGRDRLAGLFWPDSDQSRSRAALRRTLSALAKGIGHDWLTTDRQTVGLKRDGLVLDIDRFRALRQQAHAEEDPHRRVAALRSAVELYRDDFMAGFALRDADPFDEWQYLEAQALRQEFALALEQLVSDLSERGEVHEAIGYAYRWLALDALHEPAHRWLMQLHAAVGDRSAAVRQYRECVRVLERELGVAPLDETTATYRAIEEGEAVAELPLPSPRAAVTVSGGTSSRLVGRDVELEALRQAHRSVGSDGRFAVVAGEAGIGKTRLVEQLLGEVRSDGGAVMAVRCFEGEADLAYAPLAAALRAAIAHQPSLSAHHGTETSRLLPEVEAIAPAVPLHHPGALASFYQAVTDVLLGACEGATPGVLFIDDLQWADEASLDALGYLLHRLPARPVLVLGAWRSDVDTPRLRALLGVRGNGAPATLVEPGRLRLDDVERLASDHRGSVAATTARRILDDTDGVPLLVVEYLAALSRGELEAETGGLPPTVRHLLLTRAAAASETASQALAAAAVIGHPFDEELLRRVSGRSDDEVVSALEELHARGLVSVDLTGQRRDAYEIPHARIREVLYDEVSPVRRRLLHRRAAEALSVRDRTALASRAARIAAHLERSGQHARSASMRLVAADHARGLGAHAEALDHLEAALALGPVDPAEVHEAMGDVHTLTGAYEPAVTSFEKAASLADEPRLAGIERKLAQLHQRRGDWTLAEAHLDAAERVAQRMGLEALLAQIAADRSRGAYERGKLREADACARRSLMLAESAADPAARAQAHNVLGILASGRGELDEAREHLEASLTLTARVAEPSARVAALNNLGRLAARRGDHAEALALLGDALSACRAQGDRHREAALLNNLADVLHDAGQSDEAMERLKEAVTIFAELDDPDRPQPEIWKLAEW